MNKTEKHALIDALDAALGFALPHDLPVPYILRTRTYYQTLGYAPYRWAQFVEVPFAPLKMPLSKARLALVTTAAPYQPDKGDQGPGAPYNSAAKFYRVIPLPVEPEPDLRISHVGIDRTHTTAEDNRSWFPLRQMKLAAAQGRIREVAPRVICTPTNRSHRVTLEQDCPDVLAALRADGVDVAVMTPNCPICHQTISLTARYLEANGIPTVIMGCAKDIVEHVGVPRFLFSDFPLGNPAGKPNDVASQAATLEMALQVLESATGPRTTRQSPIRWSEDPDWKLDYSNVERIPAEELERRRQEFLRQKEIAHARQTEQGLKSA